LLPLVESEWQNTEPLGWPLRREFVVEGELGAEPCRVNARFTLST
jgi:hypothetical protein